MKYRTKFASNVGPTTICVLTDENKGRESDAPAELYRATAGRPQARSAVFAAAKRSIGASPSRPVFSLLKMLTKMFRAVERGERGSRRAFSAAKSSSKACGRQMVARKSSAGASLSRCCLIALGNLGLSRDLLIVEFDAAMKTDTSWSSSQASDIARRYDEIGERNNAEALILGDIHETGSER